MQTTSIYVQLPAPNPMNVLNKKLKEEEVWEKKYGSNFRANLIREIIKEIERETEPGLSIGHFPKQPLTH